MPSILYNMQGEEGNDPQHPNCFQASFSSSPVLLKDFIEKFPLARYGTFQFRFKEKTSDFGYIWRDVRAFQSPVPLYNGLIWAKVLHISEDAMQIDSPTVRKTSSRSTSSSPTSRTRKQNSLSRKPVAVNSAKPSRAQQYNLPRAKKATATRPVKTPKEAPDQSANLFGESTAKTSASATTNARSQATKQSKINTDHIKMSEITLAAGFETKSEAVQQAMIQRAKELVAKQQAKLAKKKQKEDAAERLKVAKREAEGVLTVELAKWAKDSGGGCKKLRTLLCNLPNVLWTGTKWKPVDMGDVIDPKRVRIIYMKAMRIVHPDKLKANATPEQKVRAEHIFDALNNSWKTFQEQEM